MSKITSTLWDRQTTINGVSVERLKEKFIAENGYLDRVIIAYDGVISRIQWVNSNEFNDDEKEFMQTLINEGIDEKQAIADTWLLKIHNEEQTAMEKI